MWRQFSLSILGLTLAGCQTTGPDEVAVAWPPASVQVASVDPGAHDVNLQDRTRIVVAAIGQPAAQHWPEFELLVNGRVMGTAIARSASMTHYVFKADVPAAEIEEIRVRYVNDLEVFNEDKARTEDRNLYVYYVEVDGTTLPASYRTRILRADGVEQRGQESLWWNADLIFSVAGRLG